MYICVIDQARGQGGWILAKFSFCIFMDRDEVEVHKNANIKPSWSIKDLLYGIKNTKKNDLRTCLFSSTEKEASYMQKWCFVFFQFSFSMTPSVFSFSSSIPTEKSQKIFLMPRKTFCKRKLSRTRLDFGEILLRKQNGQSRASNIGPSCPLG